MELLTSLKNPRIQAWRALKENKARKEAGLFLVEGRKLVEEALQSSFRVEAVLVEETRMQSLTLPPHIAVYIMPEYVMGAVCNTKTPQGIAAVVAMQEQPLHGAHLVALDGVQDPGNVGTIIRTADAAGFDGVLLSSQCADVYSPKVIRAAMGSVFHLPICTVEQLPQELLALRSAGFSVLSSQLDGQAFAARGDVGERFCLVIGNEGNGVSEAVKQVATHHLMLPMRGKAESLNAAVAAGIMMYELMQ